MPSKDYPHNSPSVENRFRAVLEQSPYSIQIISTDGYTVQVNKAWEQLWGLTLEQIKDYNILRDEQLIERGVMPFIKLAFGGEYAEIPPILYDPRETFPDEPQNAGQRRWTRAVTYPVKDESGAVSEVVLMHEDITAQIDAEEKLRESESRYRRVAESGRVGVWDWNLESDELYLSSNLKSLLGYTDDARDRRPSCRSAFRRLVQRRYSKRAGNTETSGRGARRAGKSSLGARNLRALPARPDGRTRAL